MQQIGEENLKTAWSFRGVDNFHFPADIVGTYSTFHCRVYSVKPEIKNTTRYRHTFSFSFRGRTAWSLYCWAASSGLPKPEIHVAPKLKFIFSSMKIDTRYNISSGIKIKQIGSQHNSSSHLRSTSVVSLNENPESKPLHL